VALLSGNRNMGLLLAALGAAADFDVVLYLALGQIPVYLTPLCKPIYRWASSRSRGRPGLSPSPPPGGAAASS
jgi:BASS family bile acid:Na+ symporter